MAAALASRILKLPNLSSAQQGAGSNWAISAPVAEVDFALQYSDEQLAGLIKIKFPDTTAAANQGWIRDLTRECVEPNPGPATWVEIYKKALEYSGRDEAFWKPVNDYFESLIGGATHDDVTIFLENPAALVDNMKDDRYKRIVQMNLEKATKFLLKEENAPPAAANQGFVGQIKVEWSGEGIRLDDPIKTLRTDTCLKLFNLVKKNGAIQIDSPPFSGKSSLCTLMKYHIEKNSDRKVIYLNWLAKDDKYWETKKKEILSSPEGTFVLSDETHKIYKKKDHDFWEWVKEIQSSNIYGLILFVSWGSIDTQGYEGSPVTFQIKNRFNLADILLSDGEAEEYFNARKAVSKISQELFTEALHMTNRQIGHLRHVLDRVDGFMASKNKSTKSLAEIQHFMSMDTHTHADLSLVRMTSLDDLLKLVDINLFEESLVTILPYTKGVVPLVRAGILTIIPDGRSLYSVCPTSNWVKTLYLEELYRVPQITNVQYWNRSASDLDGFITEAVSRMDISNIEAIHEDNKVVSEYAWQNEFYRCAHSIIGRRGKISPEMIVNNEGRLDFWINGQYKWGFELFRDSEGIDDHAVRFSKGGTYYPLVEEKKITNFAVINFRSVSLNIVKKDHRVTFVSFDLANKQFFLRRWDEKKILVLDKIVQSNSYRLPKGEPEKEEKDPMEVNE